MDFISEEQIAQMKERDREVAANTKGPWLRVSYVFGSGAHASMISDIEHLQHDMKTVLDGMSDVMASLDLSYETVNPNMLPVFTIQVLGKRPASLDKRTNESV